MASIAARAGRGKAAAIVFSAGLALLATCTPLLAQGNNTGFSLRGNSGGRFFNMFGRQSSTRSFGSQAGSVTVMNGHTGYFADGALVPFVTDVIPVVGDQPHVGKVVGPLPYGERMTPLQERLARLQAEGETPGASRRPSQAKAIAAPQEASAEGRLAASQSSSAGKPAASLAEIRRSRAAAGEERQREAQSYFDQGQAAEHEGAPSLARYYYQLAHRRAEGELRTRAAERLAALAK